MALQRQVAAALALLAHVAQFAGAMQSSWTGTMPNLVERKIGKITAHTTTISCGSGRDDTWILFGDMTNGHQFTGAQWESSSTKSGQRRDDSMQTGTFTTGSAGNAGFSFDIGQFAAFTDNEQFDLMIVAGGDSVQAYCFMGWRKTNNKFINNGRYGQTNEPGEHGLWGDFNPITNYYATFCAAAGGCANGGFDYWQFSTHAVWPDVADHVLCGFWGTDADNWKECANGNNVRRMRYFLRSATLEFCPDGYAQLGQFGDDVPGWGLSNDGNSANSVDNCASQCTTNVKCGSFEWNRKLQTCALNSWNISSTDSQTQQWHKQLACLKITTTTTTTTTTSSVTTTTAVTITTTTNTATQTATATLTTSTMTASSTTSATNTVSYTVTTTQTTTDSTHITSSSTTSSCPNAEGSSFGSDASSSCNIRSNSSTTTSVTSGTGDALAAVGNAALAQAMAEKLDVLYSSLASGNSTTQITESIPGAVLSAQRVSIAQLQASGADRSDMAIGGTDVSVSLPVGLLVQFGEDVVLTAAVIQTPLTEAQTDATGEQVDVQGLVNLELSLLSSPGVARHVSGLSEPILIKLGINASAGVQCGYFDSAKKVWSTAGLTPAQATGGGLADGPLVCASSHLTLFGGIMKGFVAAFECSQASLLSAEGISKIIKTDWYKHLPGWLFLGTFTLSVLLGLASAAVDFKRSRSGLLDDHRFFKHARRASHRGENELDGEDSGSQSGCCGDCRALFVSIFTESFASLGDICFFAKEMKNNLEGCLCTCGGQSLRASLNSMVVGFFTKLNCNVIYSATAAKLDMALDDVEYLTSQWRELSSKAKVTDDPTDVMLCHSISGNLIIDSLAEKVVCQVQQEFANFTRCSRAPLFVWYLFSQRCTLIALLRYSIFISCSMNALLFTCDMVTASALAALFFQASGGALAENVDPKCEPANIAERLGRILAVGCLTVIVGLVPSLVLSKLHQRDFVSCQPEEYERQLRLWKIQDRIIFTVGLLLIAFCFFFDLVFISNVTPEDGMAWCIACLTSMAQTLLAVPMLMTILMLSTVALARCSKQVCREVHLLCCIEGFQMEKSTFHRPPQSRWTPASRRRDLRRRKEAEKEHNLDGNEASFDGPFDPEGDPQALALETPHDHPWWSCWSSTLTTELAEEVDGSHAANLRHCCGV